MKVYIVLKNVDMNEGPGPTVVDKVFYSSELALKYIDFVGYSKYRKIAAYEVIGDELFNVVK